MPTIIRTSNPFKNSSGIDHTIHSVFYDCISSIVNDSNVHISMYMWQPTKDSPDVYCNPNKLSNHLKNKIISTNSNLKINTDVDYFNRTELSEFKRFFTDDSINIYHPNLLFKFFDRGNKGVPKLHDKTILFSKLKFGRSNYLPELNNQEIENVVLISSCNIWHTQYSQSNQVLIQYGNKEFYDFHLKQWKQRAIDFYRFHWFFRGRFKRIEEQNFPSINLKAYSFPRSKNLLEGILENIIEYNQNSTKVKIRVLIGDFSNRVTASKLVEIANLPNSDVKVIARIADGNSNEIGGNQYVENIIRGTNVQYYKLEKSSGTETNNKRKVHNKFILADCNYKIGGRISRHKITFNGSLSFTTQAFKKNSESFIRTLEEDIYNSLNTYWDEIFSEGNKVNINSMPNWVE